MDLSPTQRFSTRAEAYQRGRPDYPQELLALLERECGLAPSSRIADIGSGTGLLSKLFLSFGCEVFGVEPNPEMRAAGEQALCGETRFHSIDGRAEATGLPLHAFDLVTAGQAFHWFEPEATNKEFQRILKPGGWVVLVWNERRVTPGFMAEHEKLQEQFARERPHPTPADFTAFFGHSEWRLAKIAHPLQLDQETLINRMQSSSWAPRPDSESYQPMILELQRLFREYERDGRVTMEYETHAYYARLESPSQ